MEIRSDLPRSARWALRLLALPILGACVLGAVFWQFHRDLANDDLWWLNSRWTRTALGILNISFALWLSSMLSREPARVELDGMTLLFRGYVGRVRRERLEDLVEIHPDGKVDFRNGRRIWLASHPTILAELRRRRLDRR